MVGVWASGKERPVMVCHWLDAFVLANACSLFPEGTHSTSIFRKSEKAMTNTSIICPIMTKRTCDNGRLPVSLYPRL